MAKFNNICVIKCIIFACCAFFIIQAFLFRHNLNAQFFYNLSDSKKSEFNSDTITKNISALNRTHQIKEDDILNFNIYTTTEYSTNVNRSLDRFTNISISLVATEMERSTNETLSSNDSESPVCPRNPSNLVGPIPVNLEMIELATVEKNMQNKILPGGWYIPKKCKAYNRVAIIVPYRNRHEHLPIFLNHMHPFLIKQQIEYRIFVIEQTEGKKFNRAALMNVGYKEASKIGDWHCYIFHDVDLLPADDRNIYNCPQQPRHMSVAVDVLNFKLPYNDIFGGVSALTKKQFLDVNGFSNRFWGWGGEDDDMSSRLKFKKYHISRYVANIARYIMIRHAKEKENPKRFDILRKSKTLFETDGLNSLSYTVVKFKELISYTWILVNLDMSEI